MLTFLCFLLVLCGILMAIRFLPLAFMIDGCWWLWSSHRWVLVGTLIIGAAVGHLEELCLIEMSRPFISHRLLACRPDMVCAEGSIAACSAKGIA